MKPDEVEHKLGELGLRAHARALDDRVAETLQQEETHPSRKPTISLTQPGLLVPGAVAAALLLAATVSFLDMRTANGPNGATAAKPESAAAIPICEAMPGFAMKDYSGQEHTLADYGGRVVVLSFGTTKCPWWPGALAGMSRLASEYTGLGVVFLGVDSDPRNSPEAIAAFAKSQGIRYPILKDENNQYADHVRAERTPAMYVVARDGRLVYQGAFDDREEPDAEAQMNYVALALEELLAGDSVTTARAEPQGCPISPETSS